MRHFHNSGIIKTNLQDVHKLDRDQTYAVLILVEQLAIAGKPPKAQVATLV